MDDVKVAVTDSPDKLQFPSGWCLMAFMGGRETLHLGLTPSAWKRYSYLRERSKEDAGIQELLNATTDLRIQRFDTALEALTAYKAGVHELHPRLQNSYRPWQSYVYLAINPLQFPFIKISSDTNDDWVYLGPFRDRFALVDVMDTLSKILRLPRCETGDWPCDKLDRSVCSGWCLGLDDGSGREGLNAGEYTLDKLDSLLKEAFLHPDNGVVDLLKRERDKYFDELEFAKADLFDTEIELLESYRDWLIFLYAARQLNWEEEHLLVEHGRIRRCRHDGKDYLFAPDATQYRANESLALNLDSVDEARILYDHYQSKHKG